MVAIMLEFKYDTQLLIEGENLDEDEISEYFTEHFKGDCLLAVGDDELIKIHFHTNEPWKVLEYCASLGEIYDIVVEDMDRQSKGQDKNTQIQYDRRSQPEALPVIQEA
jgi:dihydroxyacetone kinase-like predicted kinase